MTKTFGSKRSKSFRDKYLALPLIVAALLIGQAACMAQTGGFPNTDSLRRYNNRHIRNSAVEAFTQLRLNTLLHGMINWIDSARAGEGGSLGTDTIYALNDSTIRYRKGGVSHNVTVKGSPRIGVDSIYKTNDSTLAFTIDGEEYTVLVGGYSAGGDVTQAYVDSLFSTIPEGFISTGYGLLGSGQFDPYRVDTAYDERNALITQFKLYKVSDSIAALIGGVGGGLSEVAVGYGMYGDGTPGDVLGTDSLFFTTFGRVYHIIDSLAAEFSALAFPDLYAGAGISIVGNDTDGYTIINTGTPGSNPMNALDIRNYGGIANAVVPGSGFAATGTNNTPFLQAAIDAAASGQWVIVPDGKWLFSTPLDTIQGPKRVNILILGDTYHNGSDFMIFANASSTIEQHRVVHNGFCIGRTNMPSHTQTTYDNGTKPVWSDFTGTPFKVYNTAQVDIQFNKIEGFWKGLETIGWSYDGVQRGVYENTFAGKWLYKNAIGIALTSINGNSYNNQNIFGGINGGTLRITGGLALKIDGYSGTAFNGEVYNGAFRNNSFHFVVEGVDSLAECHGDITETLFDITIEQGNYGDIGYRMRSVAPNFVRSPLYMGRGFMEENRMLNGLGIDGKIEMPIWNSNAGRFYGYGARIDNDGKVVVMDSRLTKSQRDASPSIFEFATSAPSDNEVSITASTYTVASKVRYVYYNNSSATITMPTASSSVGRHITVFNDHATNALTVANVSAQTSIPAGDVMSYRSNGVIWKPTLNPEGTGGGGGDPHPYVPLGVGYSTNDEMADGGGTPIGSTWRRMGASTTSKSSFVVPNGSSPTSPADGDEWRVAARRFMAYNGVTYEYLTVPDGGAAGDFLRRNSANTGYEHVKIDGNGTSVTTTVSYTVADNVGMVICNKSTVGACSVSLPTASAHKGRIIRIVNIGTGSTGVSIGPANADANNTLPARNSVQTRYGTSSTVQYSGTAYLSDGTTWYQLYRSVTTDQD